MNIDMHVHNHVFTKNKLSRWVDSDSMNRGSNYLRDGLKYGV